MTGNGVGTEKIPSLKVQIEPLENSLQKKKDVRNNGLVLKKSVA